MKIFRCLYCNKRIYRRLSRKYSILLKYYEELHGKDEAIKKMDYSNPVYHSKCRLNDVKKTRENINENELASKNMWEMRSGIFKEMGIPS